MICEVIWLMLQFPEILLLPILVSRNFNGEGCQVSYPSLSFAACEAYVD